MPAIPAESTPAPRPRARRQRVQAAETGMAVDPALRETVRRLHGPLCAELRLTLADIDLGATRRAAYDDLAARVGVPEMSRLVSALAVILSVAACGGGTSPISPGPTREAAATALAMSPSQSCRGGRTSCPSHRTDHQSCCPAKQ